MEITEKKGHQGRTAFCMCRVWQEKIGSLGEGWRETPRRSSNSWGEEAGEGFIMRSGVQGVLGFWGCFFLEAGEELGRKED